MRRYTSPELKAIGVKYLQLGTRVAKQVICESLWRHLPTVVIVGEQSQWVAVQHLPLPGLPAVPDNIPAFAQDLEEVGEYITWVIDRTPTDWSDDLIEMINEYNNNYNNYHSAADEFLQFSNEPFVPRNLDQELAEEENKYPIIPMMLCMETREELEIASECAICYDSTKLVDAIILNCKHQFCETCIKQTLISHNKSCSPSCALCREPMTSFIVKNPDTYNSVLEHCRAF